MISRLLLCILIVHSSVLCAQDDYKFAVSVGPEISHFAKATPGFIAADFHINHKKSLFSLGYSFPLYQQEFFDNDEITPPKMRIPMLNFSYTYKFVKPSDNRKLVLGSTIGYKFGHWRWSEGITSDIYYNNYISDTTNLQNITHISISEKREADQHHFFFALFGEYRLNKIRIVASGGLGAVFQSSYYFDEEITYYSNGETSEFSYYKDVTPFKYVSTCLHFKLGVLIPINILRKYINPPQSPQTP